MEKIVEYLKYDMSIVFILILFYIDSYGGCWNNFELFKKCVKVIKDYIVSLGIDENKIDIEGYGEKCYVVSNDNIFGWNINCCLVI